MAHAITGALYDKTGAAYFLDHEHNGTAYVRPLVKTIMQTSNYCGDDFSEEEDFEPADYLVAMDRGALFDTPPIAAINEDVAAKRAELDALKSEAAKATREINSDRFAAEQALWSAQRQLDEWMKKHRVMTDLGRLLDGQVLYPLSVRENSYHRSRDIPRIPKMDNAKYLAIHSGNFEKGQKWVCENYSRDNYGTPFRFFGTEEERAAVIREEFDATCQDFRKAPNFDTTGYTSTTNLHYGTLMEWVKTHPDLSIPDDIKAAKAENDAELVRQRKAQLAAELAQIEATN